MTTREALISSESAPFVLIERDDGTRLVEDLTGTVVDMTVAEKVCEGRGVKLRLKRPSDGEESRSEADDLLAGRLPALVVPLGKTADLEIQRADGSRLAASKEVPLGELARAIRRLLTGHDLIGDQSLAVEYVAQRRRDKA